MPDPLYTPRNVATPAYHRRFTWSGWPSKGEFPPLPPLDELTELWESDGLRVLEHRVQRQLIQFTFSVTPQVSPVFFAARVKGRLQHAYRTCGRPTQFSRKVAVGTIGRNHRADVEAYIERQAVKERFVDPGHQAFLKQFTVRFPGVDLSAPTETNSGRYWYNLHVVLVSEGRERNHDAEHLSTLRDQSLRIAAKKGHCISTLSAIPDHLHLALRGNIEETPAAIALGFMNNLAYALGQRAVWQFGYYVGTCGEYDMNAVRG